MFSTFVLGLSIVVRQGGAFVLQQKDGGDGLSKDALIRELTATFRRGHDAERLLHFEEAILPMFKSMPKNSDGNLGQATARRALHRLFLHRHGWSIEGLLPAADENDAATPRSISSTWMPAFLLEAIEQLFGTHGVNVQELAVLAAAFEDLVHREAIGRLEDLYDWMGLSTDKVLSEHRSEDVIKAYMIMYTSGGNATVRTKEDLFKKKGALNRRTLAWLKKVERGVAEAESLCDAKTGECGQLDFKATTRVVEEIGEQYRDFNQGECNDLSNTLKDLEDPQKLGHVLLSDFYKPGLHNSWNFTEREDYLRALGTLDETDPAQPRVIIPNYVHSRPNCLATSEIYVVCCKNLCEDLMNKLETHLAAPTARPERVERLLWSMPGTPSTSLRDLAAAHDGEIHIHSRAFAQWLHEAYPRTCPRPLPESISHAKDPETDVEEKVLWTVSDDGLGETDESDAPQVSQDGVKIDVIDTGSAAQLPQDPPVQTEWFRSVCIFVLMMYVALVRSSRKDGKSNWNLLSSSVTSYWTTKKRSETSIAQDGEWV